MMGVVQMGRSNIKEMSVREYQPQSREHNSNNFLVSSPLCIS